VLALVTALGMIAAPWVIWATAPGLPIRRKNSS
jgi:peptidoglycan biosynthesis protein MviN/MurJ (putative lipid II flippase)